MKHMRKGYSIQKTIWNLDINIICRVTTEEFLKECTKNVQNFLECTKMYIHQNVPKDVHKF